MKREIKFRAKTLANSHWVVGSYIHDEECPTIRAFGGGEPLVDPSTVGQYTGLKGRNGVEIYEGDIVEMEQWRPSLAEVCFDDGAFCLRQEGIPYMSDIHYVHHAGHPQATVIGNIHDNPELLKGGEEYA